MATFKVDDTFNIAGRGVVLAGNIIDGGVISIGDSAQIFHERTIIDIKISGIAVGDRVGRQAAFISLLLSDEDQEAIKDINLKGTFIKTWTAS
ncbi:MAG: hypothetical protein AB7H80_03730 [Candidatus Kapaibacterium sp.]